MLIYLGIDDADSHSGGCTTYVGYLLAREITRKWGVGVFVDFPRLIRLNPNVPFKTRGNAAVAMALDVPEGDVEDLWRLALEVVKSNSRREGKTDPGVAMAVGAVPERARTLYRLALTQVVSRAAAERAGVKTWGGRGVVGAVAAIGADLGESTFELIAYREGERMLIPPKLARALEAFTLPFTFHNLDGRRVLIQPKGPDPVYYGIRGLTPQHLLYAKDLLDMWGFKPAGWVIYRTNQAVDAHLKHGVLFDEAFPYSYYKAEGLIVEVRRTRTRHLIGELDTGLKFVVYRHLGKMAGELERCIRCHVALYGGLKPRGGSLYLYVERAVVYGQYVMVKPKCLYCGGSLESLGRSGGHRCRKCGAKFYTIGIRWLLDKSAEKYLLPRPGEWRHLLKPPGIEPVIPSFSSPKDVQWLGL